MSVDIGTGQTVEMPAAGQQGVLQVTCATCSTTSVHHVGWFDPPSGDGHWTVRTVAAAGVGNRTGVQVPRTAGAQQDSPLYSDRDPA